MIDLHHNQPNICRGAIAESAHPAGSARNRNTVPACETRMADPYNLIRVMPAKGYKFCLSSVSLSVSVITEDGSGILTL